MRFWNVQHTNPPFWCPPSPQVAKRTSFPPSPFTGPSLVGFSHRLFLSCLLHLSLLLCVLQMLNRPHSSPAYASQRLWWGAAVVVRTSGTARDSSLWCSELSYAVREVTLQLLPEAFAPLGQGFRQVQKSLNRKLFLCCFWFHLLPISLEIL